MKESPKLSQRADNQLVNASEISLILFAALMLVAAYSGKTTTITNHTIVNAQQPATDPAHELLQTASTEPDNQTYASVADTFTVVENNVSLTTSKNVESSLILVESPLIQPEIN